MMARTTQGQQIRVLTAAQEESLKLYSKGQIRASEVKTDIGCDFRELISLLAKRGLALPHVDLAVADKMAAEALALMNIPILQKAQYVDAALDVFESIQETREVSRNKKSGEQP